MVQKPLRMNAVYFLQHFSVFDFVGKNVFGGRLSVCLDLLYLLFMAVEVCSAGIIHVGRYFVILSLLGWHDLILFALGLLA